MDENYSLANSKIYSKPRSNDTKCAKIQELLKHSKHRQTGVTYKSLGTYFNWYSQLIWLKDAVLEKISISRPFCNLFKIMLSWCDGQFYHGVYEICWFQPIRSFKMGHVTGQGSMFPTRGGCLARKKITFIKRVIIASYYCMFYYICKIKVKKYRNQIQ